MADGRQHGGYRRPSNPAPVSGPGALSKRTDGRQPVRDLPNAKYGENAAFRDHQAAAPMNGDLGGSIPSGGAAPGPDLSQIVPMGAESQFPDMPIEAGLSGGPGGGPMAPNAQSPLTPEQRDRLRSYLPVLIVLASRPDVDSNTKQLVRQLKADLG